MTKVYKVYQVWSKINGEYTNKMFSSLKKANEKFNEELEKLQKIVPSSDLYEFDPMSFDDYGIIKDYRGHLGEHFVELRWVNIY